MSASEPARSRALPMKTRRMPRQDRSRRRYDAMLDAFRDLLVEQGFDNVTTHQVAERAGVPVGTLYQFFPNKFALAAALSERYEKTFASLVEAGLTPSAALPPLLEVLDRVLDGVSALLFSDEAILRLWAVTQAVPELEEVRESANEFTLGLCKGLLRPYFDDLPEGRMDAVCATLSRTVHALMFAAGQERGAVREASLAELRQIVKSYVQGLQAAQ